MVNFQGKISTFFTAAGIICFIFFTFFLKNLIIIPDSDFFGYLSDGHHFLHFQFSEIRYPSLYSIMVSLPTEIFHVRFLDLKFAVALNIFFISLYSWFAERFAKDFFHEKSLLLVLLLSTNYVFWHLALQPLNMALFSFLSVFVFWLDQKEKTTDAILLSGFGYLVRPESIALLCALVVRHLFIRKNKKLLPYLGVSFLTFLFWETVVYFHSAEHNRYLTEFVSNKRELINTEFFNQTFGWYLFYLKGYWQNVLKFATLLCCVFSIFLIWKKQKEEMYTLVFFSFFYFLIHLFYPFSPASYSFPLLLPIYFLLLFPFAKNNFLSKKGSIISIIIILVASHNASVIYSNLQFDRYFKSENAILVQWIISQNFHSQIGIYTLEPWIAEYYVTNPFVHFFVVPEGCNNLHCLEKTNPYWNEVGQIYIVNDSYSVFSPASTDFFRNFKNREQGVIQNSADVEEYGEWIKVYPLKNH